MRSYILIIAISLLSFNCGNNTAATTTAIVKTPAPFNLITEKQFNDLFPQRNAFYNYTAFMKAIKELSQIQVKVSKRSRSSYQFTRTDKATGKSAIVRQDDDWSGATPDSTYTIDYGNFCTEKDAQTNKKELAAFLANIAHETRNGENGKHDDGLIYIHEIDTSNSYLAPNDAYPAFKGRKYYGRGPIQLSYNGNYGKASNFIFGDKNILLNNPKLIETDPVIAFETAIWFWMTPDTGKPSPHDAMIGKWQPSTADKAMGRSPGFGMTINIINGPVECNKGENVFGMVDRISFYQYFLKQFGVTDPNCACSCGKMVAYHY